MSLYQIHTVQKLPISVDKAWDFLSDPENLQIITPAHMRFSIVCGADKRMYPGQIIQYTVKPFPFLKVTWVTEITHVQNKEYFVDEQRFGPYSLWHHKHFITPIEGGVLMEDIVDYKLPFGFLGKIMHTLIVKNQLKSIFDYREKKLIEIFGHFNA